MSIGNIASSVWSSSAASSGRPANRANQAPPSPPPSSSTPAGATPAGTGPADAFQQLSSDMQAKLLQLQSMGSETPTASGNTTSAAATGAMKPPPHHHRPKGDATDPDAASGLVPTQQAAGSTTTTATSGTNTSLFDAMRQAIQAYAASGQANTANLSTSLATM
jgi:hypothetical protein